VAVVPVSRKRRKTGTVDLRSFFRRKLEQDRSVLQTRCSSPEHFELMARALGLDRIEALKRGEPVLVRGWEISDIARQVKPDWIYEIDSNGRLRLVSDLIRRSADEAPYNVS
jgi:hypothetical protein